MKMDFECVDHLGYVSERWAGTIEMRSLTRLLEVTVEARGSSFHMIIGRYIHGWYLCIPGINLGTRLADPEDCFWNQENLISHSDLGPVDTGTIVSAIDILAYML